MAELPIKVRNTLDKMRSSYEHYIEVKRIGGSYCVFEARGVYDRERKRTKKVTYYLGRILDNGRFVKAKHRMRQEPETETITPNDAGAPRPDEIDRKLMTAMSMNGRLTYVALGRLAGISRNSARTRVGRLRKAYGIRYLAEIDTEELGYLGYFTFVKFSSSMMPSLDEMKSCIEAEPMIQLALLVKGEYDLILYTLAKGGNEMSTMLIRLQNVLVFRNYRSKWYTTAAADTYGFIPVRDSFFDLLQKDAEAGRPRPGRSAVLVNREIAVLRELNRNGEIEFSEIDSMLHLDSGASQYTYYSLIKKGVLKRITLTVAHLAVKYNAIIMTEVVHGAEVERARPWFLTHIIEDIEAPVNRYALSSRVEIPKGSMLVLPVFEEGWLEKEAEDLKRNLKGAEIKTMVITDTIIGRFCHRRFDGHYSRLYTVLVEEYKMFKPERPIDYTGTPADRKREGSGSIIYVP